MNRSELSQPRSLTIELWDLMKNNVRNYAMYLALIVLFILFYFTTQGAFLSARNITNLVNQTGYVAVMAVGMTLVLIIGQIDLSVGFAAGFLGAVAARLMTKNMSPVLVILVTLALGLLLSLATGLIIGKLRVPAFVTTLAGQFIFRGMLSLMTESSGTITVTNETFNKISNGSLPALFRIGKLHGLTIAIGALCIILIIYFQIRQRHNQVSYGFPTRSLPIFIAQIAFFCVVVGVLVFVLAEYKGISWTIVVVAVIAAIYEFVMKKTRLGRHIYGTGGNREAALLSGVNTQRILLIVFSSMGMLAALGGILFTSRLQSATPTAGSGFELDAIASCYIGGVSTTGGIGKVTNSIIGAFVIMSLTNGLTLMGIGVTYQYIIKGIIFILAVAFDVRSRIARAA